MIFREMIRGRKLGLGRVEGKADKRAVRNAGKAIEKKNTVTVWKRHWKGSECVRNASSPLVRHDIEHSRCCTWKITKMHQWNSDLTAMREPRSPNFDWNGLVQTKNHGIPECQQERGLTYNTLGTASLKTQGKNDFSQCRRPIRQNMTKTPKTAKEGI